MPPRFFVMWPLLLAVLVRQFAPAPAPAASWTISIQITPAPFVPLAPPPPPPVDTAPAISTAVRVSCPPPRIDAAQLPLRTELPAGVDHVTTSLTNAGWLAAWSAEHVMVSLDGGLTFTQVLDGPGAVRDVTFDCYGHAIALRDDKVGIRDGTRETWRPVPGMRAGGEGPAALVGGGPDVIVLNVGENTWKARAAISPDLGATWWFRNLINYWESSDSTGRQDADGTIHLALTTADCMSFAVYWLRIKDGVVATDDLGSVGLIGLYDDYALVAADEHVMWKKFGEDDWHTVKVPDGLENTRDGHLLAGPLPRVLLGKGVYTFKGGRLSPLRPWTLDEYSGAVDRAGRLWGVGKTKDDEYARIVAVPGTRAKIPPPEPEPNNGGYGAVHTNSAAMSVSRP